MSIREKSEAPAQAKVESTGHEAAAGGEKPRTLEHEDLESSPLAGQTAAAEPGDQLSFIPPGWISLDLRGNRLVIFLRNYPFEEKFSGIRAILFGTIIVGMQTCKAQGTGWGRSEGRRVRGECRCHLRPESLPRASGPQQSLPNQSATVFRPSMCASSSSSSAQPWK